MDHLDEIYNKWPLLDDDIWCKLIIMERNRRIGKAYARVPIVTIDGSHELSYDGYKLALNGFENPDRDAETYDCRKRIGKGIRIKMDNFGNILIKRLSKSGVFIKEYINSALLNDTGYSRTNSNLNHNTSTAIRTMPSRQQLIKNQNALMSGRLGSSQISSLTHSDGTPTSSSSSGDSSMDPPNDSAVCDDILIVGGRIDLDKIYVMFDMKKFQANITQELCRPYPDRRRLEQQCFSIVGLGRDSDDMLNLPCWVMVINIVAIEMLNERFPLMPDNPHHGLDYPDTMLSDISAGAGPRGSRGGGIQSATPNFVSIFDHPATNNHNNSNNKNNCKEEDPYSLPANASSSDVKSSINHFGTASTKNMSTLMDSAVVNGRHYTPSRYYCASKAAYPAPRKVDLPRPQPTDMNTNLRHKSKSNYDIYGPGCRMIPTNGRQHQDQERYNNSSSIYSPGHMLVPPSGGDNLVPPKLPPRDFVKKSKSKSFSNIGDPKMMPLKFEDDDNIYSTGAATHIETTAQQQQTDSKNVRKAKKNRFLESLKAPLELAKSSRSASVLDTVGHHEQSSEQQQPKGSKQSSNSSIGGGKHKTSGFTKSSAKNIKSFLGVGSKTTKAAATTTTTPAISDESNTYVHVESDKSKRSTVADSAVDSNEEVEDSSRQIVATNSSASSYNDLDIPTPDYETDENIYAREQSGGDNFDGGATTNPTPKSRRHSLSHKDSPLRNNIIHGKSSSTAAHHGGGNKNTKDDLYYSGYRAHIPRNTTTPSSRSDRQQQHQTGKLLHANGVDDKMSCVSGPTREQNHNRYLMQTSRMISSKLSGRDMIYGSTTGLIPPASASNQQAAPTGSRYRSASMQRLYPRSSHISAVSAYRSSQNEIMYDLETENPYSMSGGGGGGVDLCPSGADDPQGHYGIATKTTTGGHYHRRRSSSKVLNDPYAYVGGGGGRGVNNSSITTTTAAGQNANNNHYDIGRSSSGIYGNSGSSSSDYADCYPQMRKVNSSGYLNSIFKHHHNHHQLNQTPTPLQLADSIKSNPNNNNNINASGGGAKQLVGIKSGSSLAAHGYNNNNSSRNHASRNLKTQMMGLTKQQQLQNQAHVQQRMSTVVDMNDSAYPIYDSSNDSEPSYTNSSDGLDIYDHIGANSRLDRHQFLNNHHNHLVPEVHVGEWENLYDR